MERGANLSDGSIQLSIYVRLERLITAFEAHLVFVVEESICHCRKHIGGTSLCNVLQVAEIEFSWLPFLYLLAVFTCSRLAIRQPLSGEIAYA
jgi:hypothetical protein